MLQYSHLSRTACDKRKTHQCTLNIAYRNAQSLILMKIPKPNAVLSNHSDPTGHTKINHEAAGRTIKLKSSD